MNTVNDHAGLIEEIQISIIIIIFFPTSIAKKFFFSATGDLIPRHQFSEMINVSEFH